MSKTRIFISYSHRGKGPEWKAKLVKALEVFELHNLLDVWQDGKIRISSFWDDDIRQAMGRARLAVLLLTKEALDSEYILNTEFPFLHERQRRDKLPVFPVICEACDWRVHDWLRATQAPNESNPLSELSEAAQDSIFAHLATDIAEELSRLALAELPQADQPLSPDHHVYLNKFPLTRSTGQREEKLIGREQELALLNLAFAQPHTAIVSLVAWGGVGKTMLVQHWLQCLQREDWFGARRVYAWSFYSQGTKEDRQASEDTFLTHALEWFGVQCEPTLSPWDKGRLLADAVARERTLLILDGIEPLQYPPGPMGGQLRAPGVQSMLKHLARTANDTDHRGLRLVTTREPLTDLADFQRRPDAAWGSVLRVDLGNLTAEAGAALLYHAGAKRVGAAEVKADDAELLAASRKVEGHALTLNLLGRFLARAHGGDIRRRDQVKFEEADQKEQGGTTFKMLAAFENWFAKSGEFGARQLAILRMLGLFDRPADAACIGALRKPPVIAGLTDPLFQPRGGFLGWGKQHQPIIDQDWNTATSFLADFSLLTIQADVDKREHVLDCHPLIREYFAKRLREDHDEAWRSAHVRLYEQLENSTEFRPTTLERMLPLYSAIFHGCAAGRHEEAIDRIYKMRIIRGSNSLYSLKELGAYGTDLAALACCFSEPWRRVRPNLSQSEQSWLFSQTAYCLRALGRTVEAAESMSRALDLGMQDPLYRDVFQKDLAIRANNLSDLTMSLGQISLALQHARTAVEIADNSRDALLRQTARATLAHTFLAAGRITEARDCFNEALELQKTRQPMVPVLYSVLGALHRDFKLRSLDLVVWAPQLGLRVDSPVLAHIGTEICNEVTEMVNAEVAAWQRNFSNEPSGLDTALLHLIMGRVYLSVVILNQLTIPESPLFTKAKVNVEAAAQGIRQAQTLHWLPFAIMLCAWLRFLEGDVEGARAYLDQAWDIAERGPMRLHLADIHLYRARLFFREKPYPWKSPKDDLAAAERLINDCAYHRRDEELADAKKAIIGQELI